MPNKISVHEHECNQQYVMFVLLILKFYLGTVFVGLDTYSGFEI